MTLKKILISVGVVVILVLVGFAGFLLYRGYREFSMASVKLGQFTSQRRSYYDKEPFPSAENLQREKENVDVLNGWVDRLLESLRRGQVEPQRVTPSGFRKVFNDTQQALLARARSNGIEVGEGFAFGFDHYATGELPVPTDVPRLTQQLAIIEEICKIFFEEGVGEIVFIERDEFEGGPTDVGAPGSPSSSSRRTRPGVRRPSRPGGSPSQTARSDAGILKEGALFSQLHFQFGLESKEAPLLAALNRLAAHDMFVVIGSVSFEKTADDVRAAVTEKAEPKVGRPVARAGLLDVLNGVESGEGAASAQPEAVPRPFVSRHERVVSGPELEQPMRVNLELDVYRFAEHG